MCVYACVCVRVCADCRQEAVDEKDPVCELEVAVRAVRVAVGWCDGESVCIGGTYAYGCRWDCVHLITHGRTGPQAASGHECSLSVKDHTITKYFGTGGGTTGHP